MVVILAALGLCGFSAFSVYIKPQNTVQVQIEAQDQKWVFPLDAEETVEVEGPLGKTVVRIHLNEAWVESSPCNNQICVAAGHLHGRGEFAACLPNKVLLFIEGHDSSGAIDAAAW